MDEKDKSTCSNEENTDNDIKDECKVQDDETPEKSEVLEDEEFEEISDKCDTENDAEAANVEQKENESNIIKEVSELNNKLCDEKRKLENEIEALKDRLLRITAEYDNFRKRTVKEKEAIYTDACEDVLKNLFPVLDNLERAYDAQGNFDDLKKGIDMTIKQFKGAFSKLDVEEICNSGEFDPNMHHAVMHIEDKNYKNNQIVEVFQKGYKKGNKVLRYSMVKVAN